ncbi:hypothetical protein WI91_12435 [Burkholderia vietnamiensis]|nr:hypothetical protein WI91_12435 [Burkholderia vietnamiensis]
MTRELIDRRRRAVAREIVVARMQRDLDRADAPRDERVLRRRRHAHCNIGFAVQHVLDAVSRDQFDHELRMVAAQLREHRRQHFDRDHVARRNADDPAHAGAVARGRALERGGRTAQRLRVTAQRHGRLGREKPRRRSREQGLAECGLERRDVTAGRRLRDAERARRARQRPFRQHGEEGAVAFPVQIGGHA